MLSTIEKQLNESQRDALITGYLTFVVPNLKDATGLKVGDQQEQVTVEDLYEYLLTDPKVGDEVQTSRVAQAIASVQEYMTRIVNGAEPGLQADSPEVDAWRDNDSQYALWAAGIDVENYPENYISPITRLEKSHYFKELETTLNQNQLDPDRVQDAALAYLNEFEAVSNLRVLSGYIDDHDFKRATYYFIGRTTTKPYRYFWRKMDLNKNRDECANNPVAPNCWSDWQSIDLPLAGDMVLEHAVRPVYYNNRLYVAWVERDPTPLKNDGGKKHAYSVKFGYKRYDDSWTAPNGTTLWTKNQDGDGEVECGSLIIDEAKSDKNGDGKKIGIRDVNLLAITDFSVDPDDGRLMLGVFVRSFVELVENDPDIYGYQYCDSAFDRCNLIDGIRKILFARFIDENTLQFPVKQGFEILDVDKNPDCPKPAPEDEAEAEKIVDLQKDNGRVYIEGGSTLRVDMAINEGFINDYTFESWDSDYIPEDFGCGYGLCGANGKRDFTVRYLGEDKFIFEDTAIRDDNRFGSANLPDGKYWFGTPLVGGRVNQFYIEARDNKIRWVGSEGEFGNFLDISKKIINNPDGKVIRQFISEDQLCFYSGAGSIFGSVKFSKVADIRKFYQELKIVTPNNEFSPPPYRSSTKTFNLEKDKTICAEFNLSASYFKGKECSVNVCLKVGWDVYDYTTGATQADDSKGVWKWFKVSLKVVESEAPKDIPRLMSRTDSKRGLVQYLDFTDSKLPSKTRLNTTFVPTLIKQASLGLDSLLNYSVQSRKLEASLTEDGESEPIDFNGANGLYFWELFFHLPFLVATRFASEQQYEPAQKWLHYIFDPAKANPSVNKWPYWNARPLADKNHDALQNLSRLLAAPLDPDSHAYADPEVYRKAVFIAYVCNLIAQGDAWYRQLTRDGLTQARVYYNFAAELLGPRPDVSISSNWQARSLGVLAQKEYIKDSAIRQFEHTLDPTVLPALPGRYTSYLSSADNQYFTEPLNTLMLSHWDTLEARLYNLRHNLTVDGKPLSLPLYEAPADPVALLSQRAQAGTLSAEVSGAMRIVPPYRFSAMLPRAYNAVATLSRFGETLLSLLERSERAGQEELAQQQLLDMSSYAITLQQQAIDGLAADRVALQASQATAQLRHHRYYALYQENISDAERTVMDTHTIAQGFFAGAQGLQIASGALKEVPNIYGFSDGGSRYEGATEAVGGVMQLQGQAATLIAERLATAEGYRRRRQEWQIQYEQAQAEVDALTKQLDALAIREKAARTALQQTQAQQVQVKAMLTYLKSRFTQATLYQWLSGQLAAQYYQAYDAVVSLCLSAQACWQYEMGDFSTRFVQTGTWNDHYRGLQVGETLQLNLHQMEAAYLARHERRLEITRTVSLKELLGEDFKNQRDNKRDNKIYFEFDLKEDLFDRDYPGQYLRQIKSVSITLPTSLGPYQDVKATLTQTKSSTLLQADLNGVKYLINEGKDGTADAIITNLRASQQIALSSGLNDAGQFELNFSDERYLPFEGTGAVSTWVLNFPRPDKSPQSDLLANLDDVIVHVRYTALDGGESFAQDVEKLLN